MRFENLDRKDKGFLEFMGSKLLELGDRFVIIFYDFKSQYKQHLRVLYRGIRTTLIDYSKWYAVISQLPKGYSGVTIELKANYPHPTLSEIVVAEAKVINMTKETAFAVIEIFSDDERVACATATYSILDEQKLTNRIREDVK